METDRDRARARIRERFAANVRAPREALGLTQEELSQRCGLHLTAISKLERGDSLPGIETIVKLADILELTPNDLCAGIQWAEKRRRFEVEERRSADHRHRP